MKTLCKILGLAALLGAFVHIIVNWSVIPAQVPQHYNAAGEVDAWAAKPFIFFPLAIGFALWLLTELAQKFPKLINMMDDKKARTEKQTHIGKWMMVFIQLELACIFAYVSIKDVYVSQGKSFGLGVMEMPVILCVVLGTAIGFSIYSFTQKKT